VTLTIKILQDDCAVSPVFLKAVEYLIEKQNNTDQLSLDLPSAIRHHWQTEFKSSISEDWSCIEFSNSLDLLTFSLKFS
jgi:hypothetical protein